ncbi:translation initiation factor IF-2 [Rubrivirga sp. S365]|uniref:Translation initiation factor IF-2 n=1 Tax=Rubrivirga litoralis TaxID=3075598 RepID=A0ABU3BV98_9BACT|nr:MULTISPECIES: translation initiation factor IF-2 [unclassified Rubrivirga]MDT0633081.1 translation initiation factor IF-2 [Rubrivirga sp. F394]MDT7856913.1 translation initiation factor IF-2 [Rubrivirga sp. S365]
MPVTRKRSNKPKRVQLFKATRELNIATKTVVTALRERGFELDAKLEAEDPNARLSPEMYDALVEAYSDDADAKARVRERREQIAAKEAESGDGAATPPAEAPSAEEPATEDEEPVAPAEPVVDVPEPDEEPVAPAEPVIDTEAAPAAPDVEAAAEPVAAAPAAEAAPPAPEPEVEAPVAEAQAAEAAPPAEAEATAEATPPAQPTAEGGAAETTPEAPAEVTAAEAAAPATDDATDAEASGTTEAEPKAEPAAPPVQGEIDANTPTPAADDAGIVRANRYGLTGTKVLGKIDLSGLEGGRRKRKRKNEDAAPAPGAADGGKPSRGKKAKKGRRAPDKGEVEKNVQETLQKVSGTGGNKRTRQKRRRARRDERAAIREARQQEMLEQAQVLRVMEFISTGDLAEAMNVSVTEVISKGFGLGMMVSINQRLDADAITLLADEFDFEVEFMEDIEEEFNLETEDSEEDLVSRPPIVTIMGHVDHGKTSLLDYIRQANVIAGEAGGITQHIGAYQITTGDGNEITFLDTPGHEAFTAMRARGAQVTDLVVVVVAADDQVMPQTIEAINHARAAEVPMVVAINKIDRDTANPDKIMAQLAEQGVQVEQYGGSVQCELISALNGTNVDELLEKIQLEADLLELTANPDRYAVGTVVEARLDKGRGVVATVLVQNGTIEEGDAYVVGLTSGRVRAMFNERDERVKVAGPASPVQILGLSDAPEVGDRLVVMEDERDAREIASKRLQLIREQTLHQRRHVTLADLSRRMALGEITNLNIVVKGDVGGSVEALSDALLKLSNDEVAVQIVHSGVGAITESDVMLAVASDAVIVGFQVRPVAGVRSIAEREEIDIQLYSVIYDAIADVRDALEGLLEPEQKETVTSTIEVRETFRAPRVGTIAGSYVVEGKVSRNDRVRVVRDGVVAYTGVIDTLRRFKEDVKEVAAGYECGVTVKNYNDIKVGDQFETYVVTEEKRTLAV